MLQYYDAMQRLKQMKLGGYALPRREESSLKLDIWRIFALRM